MLCVCGHHRSHHMDTVMSVPLLAKPPLYPLPTGTINNIAFVNPRATYEQQQCFCGCASFEELN